MSFALASTQLMQSSLNLVAGESVSSCHSTVQPLPFIPRSLTPPMPSPAAILVNSDFKRFSSSESLESSLDLISRENCTNPGTVFVDPGLDQVSFERTYDAEYLSQANTS